MNKQFVDIIMMLTLITFFSANTASAQTLVINEENKFNPTLNNRFSFMLGLNPSLTTSQEMRNFSFSYSKKLENFWLDTNLMITNGLFDEMSANNPIATETTSAQLINQKNSVTTIGVGIGRETRYSQSLMPYFENLYEYMAANLTYSVYKEDFSGKSFSGPGILAKFSAYKRYNDFFSAGAHFNYNLAVVKRSQENDQETSSNRSLTLGYLTVGLDFSFFL